MPTRFSPLLTRLVLGGAALGLSFLGAWLLLRGQWLGWALIALFLPLSALLALAGDALGTGFLGTVRARAVPLALQTRPWMWLVGLSVACKVPVPLWPEGFALLSLASTSALFLAALAFVWERETLGRAAAMAVLAFLMGLLVELLGSRTGIPFGDYSYASAPPPRLLGVPLIVPLGWFALPLAGALLAGGRAWLAGLLVALWDVGLEPLMTAQHYWLWSDPLPLWAGAPLQNFLGWWAVGSGLAWLFGGIAPDLFGLKKAAWSWPPVLFRPPSRLPQMSLLSRPVLLKADFAVVYALEAFFLPGGLLLLGQYVEAAVALLALLLGLLIARRATRE